MGPRALLVLALLAAGCGWRHELAAGNAAAADQDWLAAVAHYQAAAEARPEDRAIAGRLMDAQKNAIDALVEQAAAARDGGQPERALDLLEQAEELLPRQLPVALLREEIVGQLAAAVREVLQGEGEDPLAAAVEAWAAFAQRFPVHPETARLGDDLSASLAAETAKMIADHSYADAAVRLERFQDRLPIDAPRASLREAWSKDLLGQAAVARKRGQRATAWVCTALAGGLTGQPAPGAREREAFLDAHALILGPRVSGDKAALERLLGPGLARLERSPGLRWSPAARRPDFGGTLALGAPRFSQSAKPTVAVREVPGEARDHENPAWVEASRKAQEAADALTQAATEEQRAIAARAAEQRHLDDLRAGVAAIQGELNEVQAAFDDAQAAALAARAALDEALGAQQSVTQMDAQRAALEAAVAAAQARLEEALAALERGEAPGPEVEARRALDDARAALQASPRPTNLVWELSRHVPDRASTLAGKERDVEQARAALDARRAPVQDQLDAVERAEARVAEEDGNVQAALDAQAEARRAQEAAQAERDALPQSIFGPVIDRIEIPVQAHLRTCALELVVRLTQPDGSKIEHTLRAQAETRDEERGAVPDLDLPADPLEFPDGDLQLQARAEAELGRQVGGLLAKVQELAAQWELAQAGAAKDDEARLRALLLAWLASPPSEGGLLDLRDAPDPAGLLQGYLKQRWGLDDLSWLGV
ncbi:MAG: hypothetical protein ABIO70_26945 [Pseudomonadota bacterium]